MIKVLFSTVFLLALCSARLTIPRSAALLKTDDEKSASSSSFKTLNVTVFSANNAFYSRLAVGSSVFNVLLQTARDETFIPSKPNCNGCPGFPQGYDCYNYRTCDISDLNSTVDYPLGDFSGYSGHEIIGLTLDAKVRSDILWGTSAQPRYDKNFWFYRDIQGNLGLGSNKSQENFVDVLYEQNYIWENVFSFSVKPAMYVDSSEPIITNDSALSIGFIPEDKVNKLTWISLKSDSKYSWSVPVSNVKIGSKVIDTSSEKYGNEISIDSGTEGLFLSHNIVQELSSRLETLKTTSVSKVDSTPYYICNDNYLDDYPNITLRVGNTDIVLNVFTYLNFAGARTIKRLAPEDDRVFCQLAVRESKSGAQILGNTFLLNNHVVFSKLNQTVGIYQEYKPIFFGIHQTFIRKYWLHMLGVAVLLVTLIAVQRKKKADRLQKELNDHSNDSFIGVNN